VLGVPALADDPRFARNEDRTANRDELRPLLVDRLTTRPKMDWFREIIAAGVPCGPINTVDGGVGFATEIGLDPVVEVGEGEAMVPSIRNPITFSETPADYRLPPPGLDEHGDEIRAWLAGAGGFETGASAPSSTTDLPTVEEVALRPSRDQRSRHVVRRHRRQAMISCDPSTPLPACIIGFDQDCVTSA